MPFVELLRYSVETAIAIQNVWSVGYRAEWIMRSEA
jgi:hypothetical protein